jgi:hypothetical protein
VDPERLDRPHDDGWTPERVAGPARHGCGAGKPTPGRGFDPFAAAPHVILGRSRDGQIPA